MGNNYKTIVYLTVNTVNNKIYVGVHNTENPNKFDGYIGNGINIYNSNSNKHPKTPFAYAVKKYGVNAFKRFTIKICDTRNEALLLEKIIVDEKFILREDTYNICIGGGDPPKNEVFVYQYDLKGNFIKEYMSLNAAEIENKCTGIQAAIRYNSISAGYL